MEFEDSGLEPSWVGYLPSALQTKLKARHGIQKIFANTGWLFFDKIVRMGIGLLVGVWVARYLGPGQFGMFSYALAFVALFSAIASLGLDGIVIRNIVRAPAEADRILGTAFWLKLIGGLAAVVGAVGLIHFVRYGDSLTCWLVGIIAAGMIFQSFDVVDLWFQSQVRSKYSVYARNTAFLLVAAFKVALVLFKAPLLAFAIAGLLEFVIAAVGLIIVYSRSGHSVFAWKGRISYAKVLLRDSWPLIFSGVLVMVYMRIDQVMIGWMCGDAEVGIYSVAVRLAEIWYFIPISICASVFPSVVEAKVSNEELFYVRLQKLYNLMAILAYVVAIPVTLLGGWIVNTLFGPEYSRAGAMLSILVWAGLFVNLGVARSSFLTAMNWTKVSFMMVFSGAVVNVIANLILIPSQGGMGAALATVVSYFVATYGACFFYKPLYKTAEMLGRALILPISVPAAVWKKT